MKMVKEKCLPSGQAGLMVNGILAAVFCILYSASYSQIISATAKLDTPAILIGEQTKLHLSVTYKVDGSAPGTKDFGQVRINWPAIGDTLLKQVEVIGKSKIDTMIPDRNDPYTFVQSQTLTITSFDSGYYAIRPFVFLVNGDSSNARGTDALLLSVHTMEVDTTAAIRDIKPPMTEPFQWAELIPYVVWGAAIAAAIALIAFITIKLSKRKPVPVAVKKKNIIPPHVVALHALEELRAQELWQNGKTKQYHSGLSEILRTYIEGRFHVNALEQTTDEILHSFRTVVIDSESKERLRQVLHLADLVKFAKEIPLSNENEQSMKMALAFVNGTLREEKQSESEKIESRK